MAATTGGANGGMLNLEKELICFICTEILFQPLTLLDCLHSFCGSCLKSWFQLQHHKACSSHSSSSTTTNPYTCPTCRATVKAARPNAMVNTWLEIYLTANPSRAPSQEDKDEKMVNYKPGDDILPKVVKGRRRERRSRRDEEEALERRMVEEARERSLQEMQMQPPPQPDLLQPPPGTQRDQSSRSRDRERDERRARRREAERQRRHRVHVADTEATAHTNEVVEEDQEVLPPVLPPVSSPRHPDAVEARQRQQRVMHQASLVSLISSSEGTTGSSMSDTLDVNALRDMILAEGLLDGIDINTLTEAEENILAERVAEAFRQRKREQQEQQQQQHGQVQELPITQSTTAPSAGLAPSPADRQHSRHRSASGQRRADTLPVPPSVASQPDRPRSSRTLPTEGTSTPPSASVVVTHRRRRYSNQSQSNVSTRTRSRQSSPARSSTQPETRSAVELGSGSQPQEVNTSNQPRRPDLVPRTNTDPRSSPINSTTALAQATGRSEASVVVSSSARPVSSPRGSVAELPGSGAHSPRSPSRTLSQTGIQTLAHFDEPSITCFRCYRSDIQFEVYKHCDRCDVDLCQRCYRKGRGCKHWFGFGNRAMPTFEASNADKRDTEQVELPHVLVSRSLRKPHQSLVVRSKMAKDGQTMIPLRTMSDPAMRTQEGHFCDRCGAFANSCFWSCDLCNDGEWGFCRDCVNTNHCCTHPLLPIAHRGSPSNLGRSTNIEGSLGSPGSTSSEVQTGGVALASPGLSQPATAVAGTFGPLPGYVILIINTHCDICSQSIHPSYLRYHCPSHQSAGQNSGKSLGDYDICTQCYHNLIKTNRIKRDDGPAGWRKCPQGHRMIITTFKTDADGSYRRVVNNDLVGGWGLTEKDMTAWMEAMTKDRDVNNPTSPIVEPAELAKTARGTWRWREDQSSDKRSTRERGFSLAANATSQQTAQPASAPTTSSSSYTKFPPDGGFGARRVARWAYFPEEDDSGQSELMFPRGAEIRELENVNEDWWSGAYAGDIGFVPDGYLWP